VSAKESQKFRAFGLFADIGNAPDRGRLAGSQNQSVLQHLHRMAAGSSRRGEGDLYRSAQLCNGNHSRPGLFLKLHILLLLSFEWQTRLRSIGSHAFYESRICNFIIPDSVTTRYWIRIDNGLQPETGRDNRLPAEEYKNDGIQKTLFLQLPALLEHIESMKWF
jgi:hypothetical protein